jgi:hypothetical protein
MAWYLHAMVHEKFFDRVAIIASAMTAASANGPHVNLIFLL